MRSQNKRTMHDQLQAGKCARLLKALADPERLKIVQCLVQGPCSVSALAGHLGDDITKVSHHLGVLRNAGFVVDRKQGKYVIYTLHPDVFVPAEPSRFDVLDLGCCRLELGGERVKPPAN